MDLSKITRLGVLALITILLIGSIAGMVSFSNDEIDLRSRFTQKMDERTAFYDKMWKVLNQKGQIAVKNDSSFKQNVDLIMQGRKDAPQIMMKWVQESNPNAQYSEVAALYKDLSRAVESQREGFFVQEKYIQDIVREHTNLIKKFPNNLYNIIFGRQPLVYKPITSSRTDEVIRTGKDDNVDLF
jgi:hypothetical protein